ncbi:ketoacyl-ACP synthase III family protein [Kibdelosporangium philippinense]|uniref:Ketoacyl-ACP synthase III family protein n=1 Tax=Kibdelosporangium philippinense TaxID=211113 RepID=A0ABS8Z845_9PSEU|nr:ketoacyl-ACP synthase III family protein [Kibdelosporangium philippinense]MCE7003219.1 ketoacyl-ACP synthase III family protein [Kibdelosporangium philippinense]
MVVARLTIESVTSHTPDKVIAIDSIADRLRLSRPKLKLFQRIHGFDRLRTSEGTSVLDLIAEPAARLVDSVDDPRRIRYLIYSHTIQEVAPSYVDTASELRARLALPDALAFALTQQNCASGLAAIVAAGQLLAADEPGALALVVTGEKAFSPMAQLIPNTAISGDASAACLISLSGNGDHVISYASATDGRYSDGIRLDQELVQQFGAEYPKRLAETVLAALADAGLALSDVAMIVPHNVNRSSWRRVIELLGISADDVFLDNIAEYGHCFCSDPFLNYTHLRDQGRLADGGFYVLTAVGLGATYVAMVLQRGEQ